MARCYFPGCESHANTKEHIPPKSFFPDSKRMNLMTIKSCKVHNNEKTKDDIYVLANICLNSIDESQSDAYDVFESTVKPQLIHNNQALMKKVLRNLSKRDEKTSRFEVNSSRLDSFFDCLTHGVIYKKLKRKVDLDNYTVRHIYMNLEEIDNSGNIDQNNISMKQFWSSNILNNNEISEAIEFKSEVHNGYNTEIYSVRFMGCDFIKSLKSDSFNSSITVVHKFFEHFVVVSLLTRVASFDNTPIHIGLQEK
ncbi:hypothetical protein [Photobacterium leiognathi]|uniref:hypothetical protein n=1 Tax=Photobacterium leiognathi TaxID=553611 RepID=UPI00076AD516|nr:hypothetical protein [Photobacterium leiognathi]